MADLILVDAPSRTLRELYGEPPSGLSPTCTPRRGEQTVEDWYAEQEERYGLYAELKAKRPKTLWQRKEAGDPARASKARALATTGTTATTAISAAADTPTSAIDR